jgi:hypothetical protein
MADRVQITIVCNEADAPKFKELGFSITSRVSESGTVTLEDHEGIPDEDSWPAVEYVGCHGSHYEYDARIFANIKQDDGSFKFRGVSTGVGEDPTFSIGFRDDGSLRLDPEDLKATLENLNEIHTQAKRFGMEQPPGLRIVSPVDDE